MQSVNRKSDLSGFKLNPKISLFKNKLLRTSILAGFGSLIVFIATNEISKISEDLIIKDVGIIFALMMLIIPFTLFQLSEVKRKDNIDKNMPMFLLGLVSAVQSGSNLIKAIELMADRNLGTLTPELKNLRANISWGIPIEDALETFAKRTGTKVTRRVTTLLEIAVKIGGDVAENLEMIQKHVSEMQNIEKNRKSALSPYTYTIYISFFVFIAVSVLLVSSFFTEIANVQESLIDGGGGEGTMFSSLADMDINAMKSALFNMAIIEAIFGGLAAGKIGAGSFVAGTKHVVVMVVVTIIAFSVI